MGPGKTGGHKKGFIMTASYMYSEGRAVATSLPHNPTLLEKFWHYHIIIVYIIFIWVD